MYSIPVYQPTITELEKRYVNQCLDSGWISSKGSFVERFEREFAGYVGCEHAVSVSNGTTALHAALLALDLGPGDEVIVPTLTYVASANAVTYTGATPVFVDSERRAWQLDPQAVRRAITPATKAVMPVHLYGHPCDMAAIGAIAREHDLLVVEDCAEALGSFIGDRHVGTFGDVATFSFYGNKTITTGEGGMVVTNNPELARRTSLFKGQGLASSREYWHDVVGYNYRMTNICAAIGCAQLERIDATLRSKQRIACRYRELLDGVVEFQSIADRAAHSHWMVAALVDDPQTREPLRDALRAAGVETRPLFYPVHSMPMYGDSDRWFPVATDLARRGLNLPSYPELTDRQIAFIAGRIREFLKPQAARRHAA